MSSSRAFLQMREVTVEAVETKAGLRAFLRFPERLYRYDPLWVAPLLRDQRALLSPTNPFFAHAEIRLFLAQRGQEIVGRVAAIVDQMHIERWGERAGFFGFFESLPEKEVVSALLEAARAWLHGMGMTVIRGPVSLSTNHECGLLVEGFGQPPRLLMPYNPPYYASLLEGVGFIGVKDLLSYDLDLSQALPERLSVLARTAEVKGVRVRGFNLKALREEAQVMRALYNSSWQQNWGFVPMSEAEAAFMAARLRPLLASELALVAEWRALPVGFALSLPDYNPALRLLRGRTTPWGMLRFLWQRRSLNEMRVLALGILPGYRRRGIDALLIRETVEGGRQRGYRRAELSWILEENTVMRRTVEQLGGKVAKRYRLYEASL